MIRCFFNLSWQLFNLRFLTLGILTKHSRKCDSNHAKYFPRLYTKLHRLSRIKEQFVMLPGVGKTKSRACFFVSLIKQAFYQSQNYCFYDSFSSSTVKPSFSKLFERRKNVYYCQVFTIYYVIYAMIAPFGKQQKVY